MELSVLDSSFHRSTLIESWSSLIWTERYSTNGDFDLVSNNISDILSKLPLGGPLDPPCIVAIRDSNVPMIVESHKIEKPKTGPPQIITSGRSFETVLDRRTTLRSIQSNSARVPWGVDAASPSDAAWYVIDQIVVQGVATSLDIIPEIVILDDVPDAWPDGASKYAVDPKELYLWVIETLALGPHGLRAILPSTEGNQIAISIYNGQDRRQSVVFDSKMDRFDNTIHLLSTLGSKNVMVTSTKNGVGNATTGGTPSGLFRRVDFQDLSSEITLATGADLTTLTTNKSKVSLADRTPTALFSGEIANQQAIKYGTDYFLGDKVKLSGEYGLTQDVRIAEFIRSHDATGERSYPAFEAIL